MDLQAHRIELTPLLSAYRHEEKLYLAMERGRKDLMQIIRSQVTVLPG
jgi:hypothetical protein